ncbi:TetR/AcrR family transcriptional regulator [Marinomonas posidonica]|uniref:Regulatory protein TetR n=1 Tax=Marinomonas posidonica (strain CECT 7376 / NCIMB 14433 / IVIA-Po-181) TaxID=491952 RepID=F6CWF7_MARPP|nr:TetR/AcrR family transcriptional regulator [Marinomonas posidonica]AEF53212.1 regulatory protein TetR [Marinomonas posidonica IVIA-Po-181]
MIKTRMVHQTEATRNKIINKAEALFIQNGFAGTQMIDIAAATGMSRNTLYRYYQNKYDLGFAILVAALQRKMSFYDDIIHGIYAQQYPNTLQGIEALLNAYADPHYEDDDRFIAEFDGYYAGARIPTEFRTKLTEALPQDITERLTDIVVRGQNDGSVRHDLDANHLAVTLLNAVPTFYRRMLLRQNALMEIDPRAIQPLTPMLIQLLIDGMKAVKQA